ncbi:MAG: TIR domain-containing protein [Burkholderiales bacterium]|jgi:WD40 repeat protein|nr:TIR domain-containing protein [Burkholderiales bacterium]
MSAEKKYWAFLSYSHQDTRVCERIHRELETYQVPKRLVGRETREGITPSRLFPVFRDRDELPGSSELGQNLAQALAQSRYLIVICSPAAARSRWVNEEIRQFKAMGGENRVLALIIDGEPNADDKPDSGLLECFPQALKYRVDANGQLSAERVEPIAADIRKGRESRSTALLRLIAGLLAVPFDELRQRDRERKRRSMVVRATGGLVLASILIGLALWKYHDTRMERLEELGREAMLQSQPTRAAVYLAEAHKMGSDKRTVRIMLEQAMRSVDMLSTVHTDDTDGYTVAVFSDDGTRLLASSKSGAIAVWRADNGQTLLRLPGDPQSSRHARFLPGGREIALLYQDGRVEVLEARSGKRLRSSQVPASFALGRDPAHPTLAVYRKAGEPGPYGQVMVYDLQKLEPVRTIQRPCTVALSPISADSKNYYCIASGGETGVFAYPLNADAAPRLLLQGMDVQRFELSDDSKLGVASTGDGALKVVELATNKTVLGVRDPAGGVPKLAFSHGGQLLAAAGETGGVLVWSVATGDLVAAMAGHTGRIKGVHFLGHSQRLATLGYDGFLKLWNTANATLLSAAEPAQGYLVRAALTEDGERMATFADARGDLAGEHIDPALKVWDLLSAGPMETFGNGKSVQNSSISASKTRVVFEGDKSASVWDLRSGQPVYQAGGRTGTSASVSPDGTLVATDLGVTNLASGKQLLAFKGHVQIPHGVWSHDGRVVASASADALRVWDVASGVLRAQLATVGSSGWSGLSALTPNGSRLAVANASGAILYDSQTGKRVAEIQQPWGEVSGIEASLDGKLFRIRSDSALFEIDAQTAAILRRHDNISRFGVISACDGRVRLDSRADNSMVVTSLTGNAPPLTLYGHSGLLNGIDCDADMQLLLTGGTNGDAILWNAATAKPILRFTGHSKNTGGVSFLPDPGRFATSSSDGTFLKWSFAEEKRRPLTITRRIACRIPLVLDGYTLKPHRIDPSTCLHERIW